MVLKIKQNICFKITFKILVKQPTYEPNSVAISELILTFVKVIPLMYL